MPGQCHSPFQYLLFSKIPEFTETNTLKLRIMHNSILNYQVGYLIEVDVQ